VEGAALAHQAVGLVLELVPQPVLTMHKSKGRVAADGRIDPRVEPEDGLTTLLVMRGLDPRISILGPALTGFSDFDRMVKKLRVSHGETVGYCRRPAQAGGV
jgi:hypothetical protein